MAKRKSHANRSRTSRTPSAPLQQSEGIELNNDSGMKLDVTLTMADLAKMVRTDARESLLDERAQITERLNACKRVHAQHCDELTKLALEAVKTLESDPNAGELVRALNAFTGESYTVVLTNPCVDIKSTSTKVGLTVLRSCDVEGYSGNRFYGGCGITVKKDVNVPFTPEMHKLTETLKASADVVAGIQAELDKSNQRLAELPNLVDRAESALMKAYLGKQLNTGADMLRVLGTVSTQRAALPAPENL